MHPISFSKAFTLFELKMAVFIIAALMMVALFVVMPYINAGKERADAQTLDVLNEAINRYKLLGGDINALTEGKPFANLITALQTPITKYGTTHQFLKTNDDYTQAITVDAKGDGDFYTLTRYNTYTRDATGGNILSGGEDTTSNEFDVVGATYYAVAPAGYSYTAEQTANYSTRKYNTVFAAEAALPATATTPIVINILGTWASPDTTNVTFNGTTTDSTNYVYVRTIGSARHNGVWSTTAYRHQQSQATGYGWYVYTNYTRIDGVQFHLTTTAPSGRAATLRGSGTGLLVENCIARGPGSYTGGEYMFGFYTWNGSTSMTVRNCIAYDFYKTDHASNAGGAGFTSSVAGFVAQNCTSYGNNRGYWCVNNSNITAYNCIAQGQADGFFGSLGAASTNNCSDIASDAPGSSPVTGTVQFVNAASDDYHLASGDTVAKGAGTDLSASFTTDIDGDARSVPWSIGADE